jgi:hypothetical protein
VVEREEALPVLMERREVRGPWEQAWRGTGRRQAWWGWGIYLARVRRGLNGPTRCCGSAGPEGVLMGCLCREPLQPALDKDSFTQK